MLGKTHVAVGVATSLAILRPKTTVGVIGAIAGGAIGGWICDIDCRDIEYKDSTIPDFIIAFIVAAISVFLDYRIGNGMCDYLLSHFGILTIAGIFIFLGTCIFGFFSDHRTFTHSLLGLVLLVLSMGMVCLPLALPFGIGYISHIIIDLTNKRGIHLFYPLNKGFCMDICDSDGSANMALLFIGTAASVILTGWLGVKAISSESINLFNSQQGALPLFSKFQWYLIIINVITFIVMSIDYWLCVEVKAIEDQDLAHTITDFLGLAGGGLGILLAFIVFKNKIGKENANWYAIVISETICWIVIYLIACDPFHIGINGVQNDFSSHLPLIIYLVGINILNTILFFIDRDEKRTVWKLYEFLLFLIGIIGGALGGYVVMLITKKKIYSPHFSFGFPVMMCMHSFVVGYILLSGIA